MTELNLDIELDNDPQMFEMFVQNALDYLDQIENDLLEIEDGGKELDDELINRVFRAAHTIKGDSGFIGLDNIGRLAHAIENVLDALRDGNLAPNESIVDLLLKSFDQLREMVSAPETSEEVDTSFFTEQLHNTLHGGAVAAEPVEAAPAEEPAPVVEQVAVEEPSQALEAAPVQASLPAANAESPMQTAAAKTLIIDQDPMIGKVVKHWLSKVGISCDYCATPEAALDLMSRKMYLLAICDYNLGNSTGVELIPRLKNLNPVVQVLMMTGNAHSSNIVNAVEQGAVDVLLKSNDWSSIVRPVCDALERSVRWANLVKKG